MSKAGNYKIPFNRNGMMRYLDPWVEGVEWKDNYEFTCQLMYKTFERGRSAAYTVWEDEDGLRYYMSLSVVDEVLRNVSIIEGWTEECNWTFRKQGDIYSIHFLSAV